MHAYDQEKCGDETEAKDETISSGSMLAGNPGQAVRLDEIQANRHGQPCSDVRVAETFVLSTAACRAGAAGTFSVPAAVECDHGSRDVLGGGRGSAVNSGSGRPGRGGLAGARLPVEFAAESSRVRD